jgi:hypothetical protein
MDCRVKIVPDHALPTDVKRVMVEKRGSLPTLVVAESVSRNLRFLQEWEDAYGGSAEEICLRAV